MQRDQSRGDVNYEAWDLYLAVTVGGILYTFAASAYVIEESWKTHREMEGDSVPRWLVCMAFTMVSSGSYIISGSASAVRNYGVIGVAVAVVSVYSPILAVGLAFQRLQKLPHKFPTLVEYVEWRHGAASATYFACVSTINHAIMLLGEYKAVILVMETVMGRHWYTAYLLAIVPMLSTSLCGLHCTLVTCGLQFTTSTCTAAWLMLLLAFKWNYNLPRSLTTEQSGAAKYQLDHAYSVIVACLCPRFMAEPMWSCMSVTTESSSILQLCTYSMAIGSALAAAFGFMSVLAIVSQLTPRWEIKEYVVEFYVFPGQSRLGQFSWTNMLLLIGALSLSKAFSDAWLGGLVNVIQSWSKLHWPSNQWTKRRKGLPWLAAKLIGVGLCLLMVAGVTHTHDLDVLYVPGCILTMTCFVPLVVGMMDASRHVLQGPELIVSSAAGLVFSAAYGCWQKWKPDGSFSRNVYRGVGQAWLLNDYEADSMTVPWVSSLLAMLVAISITHFVKAHVRYVEKHYMHQTRKSNNSIGNWWGYWQSRMQRWFMSLLPRKHRKRILSRKLAGIYRRASFMFGDMDELVGTGVLPTEDLEDEVPNSLNEQDCNKDFITYQFDKLAINAASPAVPQNSDNGNASQEHLAEVSFVGSFIASRKALQQYVWYSRQAAEEAYTATFMGTQLSGAFDEVQNVCNDSSRIPSTVVLEAESRSDTSLNHVTNMTKRWPQLSASRRITAEGHTAQPVLFTPLHPAGKDGKDTCALPGQLDDS